MNTKTLLAYVMCICIVSGFVFCATPTPVTGKFKLLTTLYNEKNEKRCLEFITCLEKNLKHPLIDTLHVLYDTAKDDDHGSIILDYLKSQNIKISYIATRTPFSTLFELANQSYPHCKIIVCNADIFFNETLACLEPYDLHKKFLVLSRWDVSDDGSLVATSPHGNSHDAWIFQTPIPTFENNTIKMGFPGCEHAIAYQAHKSGLALFNPALSVQCCHLHLSAVRNYAKNNPYKHLPKINGVPKCTVMEIDENQRTLSRKHLRLSTGRRMPIILNNA